MKNYILNNAINTENFSHSYPFINKYLFDEGDFVSSRNGDTKEILNFKTEVTNPYKRLVGNNERGINVFFLLAEAIWIWRGRKDVAFLEIFNSQMKEYSDDGVNFHAPYGFRMRSHGLSSFDSIKPLGEEQNHAAGQLKGFDQIEEAIEQLGEDSESRRVVISIWNADLDLGTKSKDLPCNDLLMLKIRKGKLHSTIANRSNDLHWGLPTNIFQFSFTTEIMSAILGIELGTQVHNSQSLHFYIENPIAMNMYENMKFSDNQFTDLYDISEPFKMDFDFSDCKTNNWKIKKVDYFLDLIIDSILSGNKIIGQDYTELMNFSEFFTFVYELLWIYRDYKFEDKKGEQTAIRYFDRVGQFQSSYSRKDIYVMALNFFASRIKNGTDNIIGKL